MVLSERPNGPHQQWLQRFLKLPFESYAFGKDKAIALKLEAYWKKHKSWPELGIENGEIINSSLSELYKDD
jgi:hypothetical protein